MNPFSAAIRPNQMQNMINVMRQVQQIKQHPDQLGRFLQERGVVNEQQAQEISKMGGNYEQIGHYLMDNGTMPSNVQQYQGQVQQVQNMMNTPTQ